MAANINNKPDLSFSFVGGKLVVTDIVTEYENIDLSEYVCVDYIIRNSNLCNAVIREEIKSEDQLKETDFVLAEDGIHEYYRILIPRVKKYIKSKIIKPNNIFYYKKCFYYVEKETINPDDFIEIDLKDLYSTLESGMWEQGDNDALYVKYTLVSYELLKKLFVDSQDKYTGSKTLGRNVDISLRYKRNVVLSSILLVREYLKRNMYTEADNVLLSIESSGCLGNIKDNTECPCWEHKTYLTFIYKDTIEDDDLEYNSSWVFGDSFPIYLT